MARVATQGATRDSTRKSEVSIEQRIVMAMHETAREAQQRLRKLGLVLPTSANDPARIKRRSGKAVSR
jgi:hypothetical protein